MYGFGIMEGFGADYFNSPAFQQAIAAAVQQYSPAPVKPVYYAPEPVSYDYQGAAGIGGVAPYQFEDYSYLAPQEDVYANQRAEEERAYAEQVAAQAEAQRIAAEQEYVARVEAEQAALARAQQLEAAAQRTQNEAMLARAEQARIAAEQASAERAAAEQAAVQAQAAAQAQAQAAAQVAEQARVQAEVQAYEPEPFRGIGRRGNEDYFVSESGLLPEQTYTPEPVYAPPPVATPVYTPAPQSLRGIGRGRGDEYDYFEPNAPEPIRTPAIEPMTVEAEPVAGIGSPAVAAPAAAPSLIETAAAAPAPAAGTGLQVVDVNSWSPSDADLQAMTLTRDQWNDAMASFAGINLGNLNFYTGGNVNPDYTDKYKMFKAPLSNKGNPTSEVSKKDNTFSVIEGQPVRLVDMRTGKVVFQGNGYEAADKAIELATALTKAGGNKADWEIQTSQFKNPGSGDLQFGGAFKTVANEKKNTSFINKALDVLGDAALGFIIGGPVGAGIAAAASVAGVNVSDIAYPIIAVAVLGPVGPLATAGAAALGSAVSSTVQGRSLEETLIRAGVTGVTAGVMTGTEIGGEISKAVSDTLKSVGLESQTGAIGSKIGNLINGTVDNATGDIIVTAAKKAAEEALKATTASGIGGAVSSVVSNAVVSNAVIDSVQKTIAEEAAKANEIVVTGNLADTVLAGYNPVVETAAGIAGGLTGVGDLVDSPELRERIAEEKARVEEPKEEIVVTATPEPEVIPVPNTVPEVAGIGGAVEPIVVTATKPPVEPPPAEPAPEVAGIGGAIEPIVVTATKPPVEPPPEEPAPEVSGIGGVIEPIVVTAPKVVQPPPKEPEVTGTPIPGVETLIKSPEFQEDLADEKAGEDKEKSLLEKIGDAADIASAVLPIVGGIAGGGGGGGGTLTPDTTGINFTKTTLRPTIPAGGIGGVGGRYPYTPETYGRRGGDQETEYLFFTKDPVTGQETVQSAPAVSVVNPDTVPVKKEGGEINDDMVKHLVDYHKNGGHQGPGQVKGIGSGQEDKIPAYLSDGEYVWSAQDVSDLGDGSNREGVRRLDKMRQMVRSQAGRKDVKKIAKPQKGIDRMLKAVGGMA